MPFVWRLTCMSLLLAVTLWTAGCAASQLESSAQAAFDAVVAEADAARLEGDAETAFDLYTQALKTEGATDTAGAASEHQQTMKRLVLARRILAGTEQVSLALDEYVQVLVYASPSSTESVEAQRRIANSLRPYSTDMRDEAQAFERRIEERQSVGQPQTAALVPQLADNWSGELADAPEPARAHALKAVEQLKAAGAGINRAFGLEGADAALRELAAAERALDAADGALESLSSP